MQVIDFHIHPDPSHFKTAAENFHFVTQEMKKADIQKAAVLQLNSQPWTREEIGTALGKHPELFGFVSIHPLKENGISQLEHYTQNFAYRGLKLHPRLDGFEVNHPKVAELVKHAGKLSLPVIIDAFPDGNSLIDGFNPADYAKLCRSAPDTKVIVAHFGGIRVLDFLLIAKRVPNMYLNVAYTLLYFRGSSVTQDLVYAIQSMRGERIFYGSDYPDRGIIETLQLSLETLEKHHLAEPLLKKLMFENAQEFMSFYEKK